MYYYNSRNAAVGAASSPPAFNAVTQLGFGAANNNHNLSHTTAGTSRLLVVSVTVTSGTDILTGATYNGVSLIFPASARVIGTPTGNSIYLGYLINPALGANTITVNLSASQACSIQAVSYTDCNQTTQFNVIATNTANGPTSITGTLTTTVNNSWVVMAARNDSGNYSAGALTTARGAANSTMIFDSNGPVSPAASRSLIANSLSAQHACVIATILPL